MTIKPQQGHNSESMALHRSEQNAGLAVGSLRATRETAAIEPSLLYLASKRKRLLDIIVSSLGVSILALMFLPVALAIKLSSRGPVFYRQRRMGRHGEVFELIKFRTMTVDAESAAGPVWAKPNDPRTTRVGRILRRLYIDEFPQWWNVMKGQMSVVGPRPERPELTEQILDFVPNFNQRLRAKPGITGVAQVNYRYTNTMLEARNKLRHDVIYINAASFRLDIQLILRTLRRVWLFKGT